MAIVLTDIPKIMDSKNWTTGAALMRLWFSKKAATAPDYACENNEIVKMKWALGHDRARKVYTQLMRERIWSNTRARAEIRIMLARNGLLRSPGASFSVFQSTQAITHANHINYREVNQDSSDDLDDLTAALGNFSFYVRVGGTVERIFAERSRVTITHIGVYIRDSYDFNNFQHLGFWNSKSKTVSATNPFAGDGVTNADFRAWRKKNNKGGDINVFSDVQINFLRRPEVFEI